MQTGQPKISIALDQMVKEARMARIQELFSGRFKLIEFAKEKRKYQLEIGQKTIEDIKGGVNKGRWDIAVGGGKTVMALSLAKHIVDRGGRVLYLTPGNTELDNSVNFHEKSKMGEKNYMVFHNGEDISDLAKPGVMKSLQDVKYFYGTTQMLSFEDRFKRMPKDYFDLIIIDESQGFLGEVLSGPVDHFLGAQVHMSATPYTAKKHVGDIVPHLFGEVTSEDLINNYNYPKWKIRSYSVKDKEPEQPFKVNEDFDFNKPELHKLLNLGERFLILERICEEIVLGNKLAVGFMTTIADAEAFVKYIASTNEILKGKVGVVGGIKGDRHNSKIEKDFRDRKLNIVFSRDLWNQGKDIPEITDIVLADPCRSMRKLIQRIGRGTRPSYGKQELIVHDIVSSVFHASAYGEPAVKAEDLISEADVSVKKNRRENNENKLWAIKENVHPYFLLAVENRSAIQSLGELVEEVEMRDVLRESFFLADVEVCAKVLEVFAHKIYKVHPIELINNLDMYLNEELPITISFQGKKVQMTLKDAVSSAKFYGSWLSILDKDFLNEENYDFKSREDGLNFISEQGNNSDKEIVDFENKDFKESIDYISTLNQFLQEHDKSFRGIVWKDSSVPYSPGQPQMYFATATISLNGKVFALMQDKSMYRNKMKSARQMAAFKLFKELEASYPELTSQIEFKYFAEDSQIYESSKIESGFVSKKPVSEEHYLLLLDILSKEDNKIDWYLKQGKPNGEEMAYKFSAYISFPDGRIFSVPETGAWYPSIKYAKLATAKIAVGMLEKGVRSKNRHEPSLILPKEKFDSEIDYVSTLAQLLQKESKGKSEVKWESDNNNNLNKYYYAKAKVSFGQWVFEISTNPDEPRLGKSSARQAAASLCLEYIFEQRPKLKSLVKYKMIKEGEKPFNHDNPNFFVSSMDSLLKGIPHNVNWIIQNKSGKFRARASLTLPLKNANFVTPYGPFVDSEEQAKNTVTQLNSTKIRKMIHSIGSETVNSKIDENNLSPNAVKINSLLGQDGSNHPLSFLNTAINKKVISRVAVIRKNENNKKTLIMSVQLLGDIKTLFYTEPFEYSNADEGREAQWSAARQLILKLIDLPKVAEALEKKLKS